MSAPGITHHTHCETNRLSSPELRMGRVCVRARTRRVRAPTAQEEEKEVEAAAAAVREVWRE
eukprot:2981836-Rhodomonas_salina.1